jgi:hypothetical protein
MVVPSQFKEPFRTSQENFENINTFRAFLDTTGFQESIGTMPKVDKLEQLLVKVILGV